MQFQFVLLLWWFLVAGASAQEQPLSLDEAIDRALQSAPQVQATAANVDAAQALVLSAGRLPDPQLILGIDNLPVTGPDAYSTSQDFMTMRKVGVMQEFPRARKRDLARERAEAETDVATAELLQSRLEVARDVAQAWIRRATAESSLAQLRALLPDLDLQAASARAAVSAGRSSTAEALAAEAAVARLATRVLAMQSEVQRATLELARWIDAEATRPLATLPSFDHLATPAPALLASIHEHGALLAYRSREAAARIDVDLARAERRPDWSAELAFAKRGPEFSDMVSLQFQIDLPLLTRNRQDPVVSAKHAELRRLEAERESELRMHTAEVQQMLTEWELLGAQLTQYDEILQLARERSRAALASYRAGRGDLRLALEAFAEEVEVVVEHAQLQNERGRAWAFLSYLGPQHLQR